MIKGEIFGATAVNTLVSVTSKDHRREFLPGVPSNAANLQSSRNYANDARLLRENSTISPFKKISTDQCIDQIIFISYPSRGIDNFPDFHTIHQISKREFGNSRPYTDKATN